MAGVKFSFIAVATAPKKASSMGVSALACRVK